ncbi:hypothetical protein BOTBODRAFT_27185 [Botryobasidium botryosum FD-172 SS1]|uniref:S1/P1 nuclease n=1 Tax=Botryobasidium botryosum (strain FD-172 SS1) TaxID=930990 RepID=A0A067MVJ3_BOTB1|nr:hypothetical protein BOTBODRAFT_27185 [Botryobasidium botryosum FD-172 SS1]
MRLSRLAAALPFAGSVIAWGELGHRTVAAVAQNYLAPATQTWVASLLGSESMVDVSTWADEYRFTSAGRFSAPYHFLDAMDSPPKTCDVDFSRDCGGACIVGAITNYTSRVQDQSLSQSQKYEALKFLVHFLGDNTQPLHIENLEKGGNEIHIKWNGKKSNLHTAWDTLIPEKYIGGNTEAYAESWAKQIVTKLESGGAYAASLPSWVACADPSTAQTCSVSWASDANAFVCSVVLQQDPTGQELSGDYYNAAIGVVEMQLAKGVPKMIFYL